MTQTQMLWLSELGLIDPIHEYKHICTHGVH